MSGQWCVALESVRAGDVGSAGGKAANLGELLHAGFDVPPGFVVTTAAHRAAMRAVPQEDHLGAVDIPDDVAEEIRRTYGELGGPVAVRSSATAEDLPGAAFAGQQDTYLNLTGVDAVLAGVRDCWASLFSDRAVAYRGRLGIDPATVAMGVVVQRMVPADTAGVMFTADPVTGARDQVVIDAARGLGEAVVSGLVTPDHFVVDARDQIVARRQGGAGSVIEAVIDGGTRQREHVSDAPALTEHQVMELAQVGRRIAEHFTRPQDIEWAFRDGHLFILQARAMTALPPPPITLSRIQRFMGPTLLEMLPRRPYPMELTAWIAPTLGAHVADMLEELTGVQLSFEAMLPSSDEIVQEFVPPSLHPSLATPVRLGRSLIRGLRGSTAQWRDDPLLQAHRSGVSELNHLDPHLLSLEELVAVPQRASDLVALMTKLRVKYLARALVGMVGLRVALAGRTAVLPELIGTVPTMTRAANDELAALAVTVRGIAPLRELLEAGKLESIPKTASSLPSAAGWWRRFERFLATYGHRETTSIMLLHDPAWVDSPATVLGLVRMLMDEKDTPTVATAPSSAADTALRSGLVRRLARRAAEGVAFREDTHFEVTRTAPAVRRAIVELGQRLLDARQLDVAEDVWFLTLDEVAGWATGASSGPGSSRLRGDAARRRTAWTELASTPLIATATLYPQRRGSAAALVTGAAGGGGRATGAVRVVRGPDEFSTLRAGEVLVCPSTNPSWTPLFQRAAAVVVDHGGVASHAAIVAREYGIPAVMGAATATSRLHDGQLVTVDGDLGEVLKAQEGR